MRCLLALVSLTLLPGEIPLAAAAPAALAIHVQGNRLVDGAGRTVQLRGVNMAGFGIYAIQGWAWSGDGRHVYDNWGLQRPRWAVFRQWGINAVRLPLNEASWLGLTTYDPVPNSNGGPDGHHPAPIGNARLADPGGNYRQQYIEAVETATAEGLYVIVDLHSTGPNVSIRCARLAAASGEDRSSCEDSGDQKVPMTPFLPAYAQNPLPDADHSVALWTSVAATFKHHPNVIFDLFNEPFIRPWFRTYSLGDPFDGQWDAWRDGTTVPFYYTGGTPATISEPWASAGMQSLIDTVRAAGATNVVMCGGLGYAGDMSGWRAHMPQDPLHQLVASWHAYAGSTDVRDPRSLRPAWGAKQYEAVARISRDVPVIIGETGSRSAPGTVGAPFLERLLPWADRLGISYLGWSWNVYGSSENELIRDFDGTPTDGYGRYYRDHLRCVAKGQARPGACE